MKALRSAAAMAFVASSFIGASGQVSVADEEIYDLPDLIYSSKVYADKELRGHANACDARQVAITRVLCEPDPYASICGALEQGPRKEALEHAERLEDEVLALRRKQMESYEKGAKEAVEILGPVPAQDASEFQRYRDRFFAYVGLKIKSDTKDDAERLENKTEELKTATEKNFKKALDVFYRTIQDAPWPLEVRKSLIRSFKDCGPSFVLADDLVRSASASRGYDIGKPIFLPVPRTLDELDQLHSHKGLSFDPMTGVLNRCSIKMSAKVLADCAAGRPICFHTLFHELGHFLNSCNFLCLRESAREALVEVKEWGGEKQVAESRVAVARKLGENADLYSRLLKDPDFLDRDGKQRSCLSVLSNPKDAVPSSCRPPPVLGSEVFQRRCPAAWGYKTADMRGYPAQWDEAEADMWGATLLARWLASEPTYGKNIDARHRTVSQILADWCADDRVEARRKFIDRYSPELLEILRKLEREKDFTVLSTPHVEEKDLATHFGCEWYPKKGVTPPLKPWNDDHQTWQVRFDRHYLRNSDLRRELGCGLSVEVPLSCSPMHGVSRHMR